MQSFGKGLKKMLVQFGANIAHGSIVDIAILISGVALVGALIAVGVNLAGGKKAAPVQGQSAANTSQSVGATPESSPTGAVGSASAGADSSTAQTKPTQTTTGGKTSSSKPSAGAGPQAGGQPGTDTAGGEAGKNDGGEAAGNQGGTVASSSSGKPSSSSSASSSSKPTPDSGSTSQNPGSGFALTLSETSLSLVSGDVSAPIRLRWKPYAPTGGYGGTWSSTNAAVATVDGGSVAAVAPGTATITYTSRSGEAGSCEVTVTAQNHQCDFSRYSIHDATCTAGGYTEAKCSICGNAILKDRTPMLAHTKPAQPAADGSYYCTVCGQRIA